MKEELEVPGEIPSLCNVFEVLTSMEREEHERFIASLSRRGEEVALTNKRNADVLARDHSFMFEHDGHSVCVLNGPATPVLDYTRAAAKKADIGVNIRYEFTPGQCKARISLYTNNYDISLEFIHDFMEDVGGREHSKGGAFKGIREFPTESFDQLLHVIHDKQQKPPVVSSEIPI